MRISDWSSDVCSSDLDRPKPAEEMKEEGAIVAASRVKREQEGGCANQAPDQRREQHRVDTSHRSTRQKKGDQFEPGRITAPDQHRFEGKPWKDRKSVVKGKSVSGREELGGRRII